MGKYIGNSAPYGVYEKQSFQLSEGITKFTLSYKVGYSTSVLVVWVIQGTSIILEPEVDYTLVDGGTAIQLLTVVPYIAGNAFDERLYAIYLGRELSVPVPAQNSPLLIQQSNVSGTNVPVTTQVYLDGAGLIVLKDGVHLRLNTDFTIGTDGHSIDLVVPASNASFDFYVFSGIKRLETTEVIPKLTTEQYNEKSVTSSKLNLKYVDYKDNFLWQPSGPSSSGQVGSLIVESVLVQEAVYMVQGDLSDTGSTGSPVKVRVKFSASLTGAADNKVRFNLPPTIKNVSTIVGGTAVITNDKTMESGILRWAGEDAVDIYRPSGTNFELSSTAGSYVFEAAFEYLAKVSS